jgi:hypothetical protein
VAANDPLIFDVQLLYIPGLSSDDDQ